jgi:hypothetical protein
MVATLSDSAAFWASLATLWGAAAAWFTYFGTVWQNRKDRDGALRTLLSGLNAELAVVNDWAGGSGSGYPNQMENIQQQQPGWFVPSRLIFSFQCPLIHGLTNSPYIRELQPIVADVVALSRSITRLFDCYGEYRTYVTSQPTLYDSVMSKITSAQGAPLALTNEERTYVHQISSFNAQIHMQLIGGKVSPDPLCLHRTYCAARDSVNALERNLKPPAFPIWYWAVHLTAAAAVIKGLALAGHWVGWF